MEAIRIAKFTNSEGRMDEAVEQINRWPVPRMEEAPGGIQAVEIRDLSLVTTADRTNA